MTTNSAFKKFINNFTAIIIDILFLLLLLIPLLAFRFNFKESMIPAFEIILIYYKINHSKMILIYLFLIGLFIDQLYFNALGMSSLIFTIGYIIWQKILKYSFFRKYETGRIKFAIFCAIIFLVKWLTYFSLTSNYINYQEIITKYFVTILFYLICKKMIKTL